MLTFAHDSCNHTYKSAHRIYEAANIIKKRLTDRNQRVKTNMHIASIL